MPRQPTDKQLAAVLACLTPAVALLNELYDGFGTPFILAISNTTLALISAAQNVKRNKHECLLLLESTHTLVYVVIQLHIKSEPPGSLPPATLDHIGKFTKTLHKIHTFCEAQFDTNRLRQFLRQNETNTLLNECRAGLKQASEVFKIEMGTAIVTDVVKMHENSQRLHQELLDLILAKTDDENSDTCSSIYQTSSGSHYSSMSFSMLPPKPKIFHGRESELNNILASLNSNVPRIAILGPGGIGKTSLAKMALHHPDVSGKYGTRVFVSCDPATTPFDLAALIGSHLDLKPGKDLMKPVVEYFSRGPPCLLVLDNLETSWEIPESRGGVEAFLSLLTDIQHLALIITMRGAERPAKVHWTHPFIPPLKPLSDAAARKTFCDIADDVHNNQDITQLLELTDNLPLAVDLLAHLVDHEGCASVLKRWKTEKTSLLSDGHNKGSNLDSSIAVSLSSLRVTSGAKELLSLLAILPDGLSDAELLQSSIPIHNILSCKAVLLQTSLAYINNGRLRMLAPIREYMQQWYPTPSSLIQPLHNYLHSLLKLCWKHRDVQTKELMVQVTANLGNLQHILAHGMHADSSGLAETISTALLVNHFRRTKGHGPLVLMERIPALFAQFNDHRLETQFIIEVFYTWTYFSTLNLELLAEQGINHLAHFDDPLLASKFYMALGLYHKYIKNTSVAMQFLEKSLMISRTSENSAQQAHVLADIAELEFALGNYTTARMHTHEAQQISRLSGSLLVEARALGVEARCCGRLGNNQETILLSQKARELLSLCGMHGSSTDYWVMQAETHAYFFKSDYAAARQNHAEIVQSTSAQKDPWNYGMSLLNIAEIDVITGRAEAEVDSTLEQAKAALSSVHSLIGITYCELVSADLQLREGNTATAKAQLEQHMNSAGTDIDTAIFCLERLGDIGRWSAESDWPSKWTFLYLGYAKKSQRSFELHKALQFLGDMFLSQGDEATADSLFVVALVGFTSLGVQRSRADCMLRLGDIAERRGDDKDVAKVDTRLGTVDKPQ